MNDSFHAAQGSSEDDFYLQPRVPAPVPGPLGRARGTVGGDPLGRAA